MRANRLIGSLACALTAPCADPVSAEDVTYYYAPFVKVLSATLPGSGGKAPSYVYWSTTIAAFNNSATPAALLYKTVFGSGLYGPFPFCLESVIPPFTGVEMETVTGACTGVSQGAGPGFVLLATANPNVIVGADVQRVISVAECGGGVTVDGSLGYNFVSQGSSPLPVYKGLMPGNTTAVLGPIDLGAIDHPETCITGSLTHRRRVNVTLFNGGGVNAEFTVAGRRLWNRADPVFEIPVVLGPQEVRQLNSIPIALSDDLPLIDGYDVRIWLSVTSTQPFLAYVTTIFEGGEPGTSAVTVYGAHASN